MIYIYIYIYIYMWDSYLIWQGKDRIITCDEIPNEVFQVGVSVITWTEYLNIFKKAHTELLQAESKSQREEIYRHCWNDMFKTVI